MALTYELIAKTTLSSNASTISFTSIPQTYTDLMLWTSLRTDRASSSSDWAVVSLNSSTSNFRGYCMEANGTAITGYANNFPRIVGMGTSTDSTANIFGVSWAYFPNYSSTTVSKQFYVDMSVESNATLAYRDMSASRFDSTSAITRIDFSPRVGTNFLTHSTAYLYGIKNS